MSDCLPIPMPLAPKGYSLSPDMLQGWRPTVTRKPFPLIYDSDYDYPCSNPCIYNGYKPTDSFIIHSVLSDESSDSYTFDKSHPQVFPYFFQVPSKSLLIPHHLHDPHPDCLLFDSKFECGNLDRVDFINKDEYELYLRIDTNTGGHMHWFYFSVSNIKHKRTVRFNIMNFTRKASLFTSGMRPRVFSAHDVQNHISSGWEPGGDNIRFSYSRSNLPSNKKPLYSLSFSYKFQNIHDKVWFATAIPYTYCRLQKIFKLLESEKNSYITTSSLCRSLSMIEVPLITVTNPHVNIEKKKFIVVVGRVHPAETSGSWVMEGFLRFLVSKHPEAVGLRNRFVVKIVPMINPDGVIVGNSRTSMSGDDLNRKYNEPDENSHPEIVALKGLVEGLQAEGREVFIFVDMHGHFAKKGSFIYGPCYPVHDPMYYKTKIIPRLIGERTEMFRYYSSKFLISKNKKKAARAVMSSEFGISHSYTLETSYYGYLSENRDTVPFMTESLFELGEKLARSIFEYYLMVEKDAMRIAQRKKKKLHMKKVDAHEEPIEDFCFELPHFSFAFTSSHNKNPVDNFSAVVFKKEIHNKRNLEEWIAVMKNDAIRFSSSSEDSASEDEETIDIKKQILPPLEKLKKNTQRFRGKMRIKREIINNSMIISQEDLFPKNLSQDIKKSFQIKQPLFKTLVTPKKLMEVRTRSTIPYIQTIRKNLKSEIKIYEPYRPSSLNPYASYENKEKESLQNIINNIAYI